MYRYLKGIDKNYTTLHWAAHMGHKKIAQGLIEDDSVDINHKDKNGCTPLHWAAACGFLDVVKLLLEAGSDKAIKSNKNKSASDMAKTENLKELINDFDYNQYLKPIANQFIESIEANDINKTLRLIKEYPRATVNYRDNKDNTLLHLAVISNNLTPSMLEGSNIAHASTCFSCNW